MKSEAKFYIQVGMVYVLAVVLGVVLVVGCAGPPTPQTTEVVVATDEVNVYEIFSEGNVQGYRIVDHAACVVCWYVDGYNKGGVSCLPVKETTLDVGCERGSSR